MRWIARLAIGVTLLVPTAGGTRPIDRKAVVTRQNPTLDRIDPHAPLMIGNGNIAFTADITGLQTFPEQYSPLAPLLTMAQWAWHSFPNPNGYTEADGLEQVAVPGRGKQPYAWMRDFDAIKAKPALAWLRENPHRFSLGRIGLALLDATGKPARFDQLSQTHQHLDMWTGTLRSSFRFDGARVSVETRVHPDRDMIVVAITSPLVGQHRLGVDVRYPGVSHSLNPDPTDWAHEAAHRTEIVRQRNGQVELRRTLDDTVYRSWIAAPGTTLSQTAPHSFRIMSRSGDRLVVSVTFDRAEGPAPTERISAVTAAVSRYWIDYWTGGGMVDLAGSTDPRAAELQRRIVLSQYLSAINEAGEVPPQEDGLFSNSWNGKFHLEVHPWHAAHFATWGRAELLERSMAWYLEEQPRAQAEAKRHGVSGAWWPKMSGPEGRNSPSPINPFIMWQQPNPIYMAELLYRADPTPARLARYGEMVDQTARLLATWPHRDPATGRASLGPPIIPVQENHNAFTTANPLFEVEYFRWALQTAQHWRERRGLTREPSWDRVIADLAPPPQRDGLYLPVETEPDFWKNAMSAACSRHGVGPICLNRDHPSFLMAYGWIGGDRIDPAIMRATLNAVRSHWDLRQTWGWDYPMIAMTAARLGMADDAIDWLMRDERNNQWSVNGLTPRATIAEGDASWAAGGVVQPDGAGPDGPGYRRVADAYLPSNGSLLLAVGMMAGGWDGSHGAAPGFPKGWHVRVENIRPIP